MNNLSNSAIEDWKKDVEEWEKKVEKHTNNKTKVEIAADVDYIMHHRPPQLNRHGIEQLMTQIPFKPRSKSTNETDTIYKLYLTDYEDHLMKLMQYIETDIRSWFRTNRPESIDKWTDLTNSGCMRRWFFLVHPDQYKKHDSCMHKDLEYWAQQLSDIKTNADLFPKQELDNFRKNTESALRLRRKLITQTQDYITNMNLERAKQVTKWENQNPLQKKTPMPTQNGSKQEERTKKRKNTFKTTGLSDDDLD